MAYIELDSGILGSSQDNFLVFQNNNSERPYVTFYFNNSGQNPVGQLTIKDALDDDGYNKVIKYSPSESISDSSFKVFPSDRTASTFSFLECLRKNQIFFDIKLAQDIPNVGIIIKANIDSSTRYTINGGGILTIGGTYSSYNPKSPNKFVLLENTSDNQITLEKYAYSDTVSFNVTAPFEHLSFKDPFEVKLLAYKVDDNNVSSEVINNHILTVFPTTLSKFSDTRLKDFFTYTATTKADFLTNNMRRSYNYGEVVGLSVMSSKYNLTLSKKYYTISGKYLGEDSNTLYTETYKYRNDFYFNLDLEGIEASTNKQVGYVLVTALDGVNELTNPIRYDIAPKCNQNNEIFFVNEVGGIDSFNFLGEREYEASIDDQTTYFRNPTRKWDKVKEIEIVGQKKNKVEHTLKTTIIDEATARWLNELNKSKYAFLFVNGSPTKFQKIIVTDFDIDLSDRENVYELEMTYQDSDNNISI